MRAVVDTNVVVSGILNVSGAPGKVVDAILRGEITAVYSVAILGEYREVLRRGKFGFTPADIAAFLEVVESEGESVMPLHTTMTLPDDKDRPFIDAALAALCPVITGNAKHFPKECGVAILTPADALAYL